MLSNILRRNTQGYASSCVRRLSSSKTSSKAALTQISKLANGITVATDPSPGHFGAMGVYIDAGSRYEDTQLSGVSHITDRLGFKSTTAHGADEMQNLLDALGGNYMCASSRETMMYQTAVFNKDVDEMFGLLADTVRNPKITPEEVEDQKETAAYEIREIWQKSELILPELFHMAAYKNNTLGNPLLCPKERIPLINRNSVLMYRDLFYQPERIVLAFVGIDHERAIKLAERRFGDMKHNSHYSKQDIDKLSQPAHYTGGIKTLPRVPPIGGLPELSYLHIGFEGLSIEDEDIYALATLQTILGGGGSFSAGGPGKGMYSRLYTHVLNKYGYIESCQAFNHSYTDSGLFGIASSCMIGAEHVMADTLARQFHTILNSSDDNSNTGLQEIEVERAKNQLRSSLLMNLESRMVLLEDLGRQVQVHGRKIPVSEMSDKIRSLTRNDIIRVTERIVTGNASKNGSGLPTIIIQGEADKFGNVQDILTTYGLGKSVASPKKSRSWW